MTQQIIGIGSEADDGTGDPARTAGQKINENFTELYELPYHIQVALSGNGQPLSAGTRKGLVRVPRSGIITGFVIDCDPSNEPDDVAVQVDLNTVDRSTGTSTSVLSSVASIATGENTGTGAVSGEPAVAAGDLLDIDIDQGTDGQELLATIEITPT